MSSLKVTTQIFSGHLQDRSDRGTRGFNERTTNPDAPTRSMRNIKQKNADQPAPPQKNN